MLPLYLWLFYSLITFTLGSYHTFRLKNAYGKCPVFFPNGSFVWADAVVFGLFWFLVSGFFILFPNSILFYISLSLFWLIRSLGETVYWFNQQFSPKILEPPETLFLSKYFPGNSVWFVYQIFHQCLAVISGLALIYLTKIYFFS